MLWTSLVSSVPLPFASSPTAIASPPVGQAVPAATVVTLTSEFLPLAPVAPVVPLQTYLVLVTSPLSRTPLRLVSGPLRRAMPPFVQWLPAGSVRASNTWGAAAVALSPGTVADVSAGSLLRHPAATTNIPNDTTHAARCISASRLVFERAEDYARRPGAS